MAWVSRSTQSLASDGGRDRFAQRSRMSTMHSVFPSREQMREQMLADMTTQRPTKNKKFKETGFAQWMARHPRFEQATLLMISLNAIWIAVDTDWNKANVLIDAQPPFQVAEHMFCSFFLYEWTVRLLAFRSRRYALQDAWFVFDSLLVLTMVLETWVLTIVVLCTTTSDSARIGNASLLRLARLLRLMRMARMARLLRAMPELVILIKGMLASLRSVVFTLGLLLVIVYIFAIAFTQICVDSDCEVLFPKVPTAMHTLFLNGALMDNLALLTTTLEQQNLALLFLFYAFVLLTALTLMNMLVGVICEVVSSVAETERECITLDHVNEKIRELVSKVNDVDVDGDDKISKEEFMKLLRENDARRILSEVGVDIESLVDLADTIFDMDQAVSGTINERDDPSPKMVKCASRHSKIDFSAFIHIILNLRGTNQASFRDIIELRKFMTGHFTQLDHKVRKLETAQRTSMSHDPLAATGSVPSLGAMQRRRGHSRSRSPAGDVTRRKKHGRSPSPSIMLAAESQVASHCHGVHDEFAVKEAAFEEAAKEFQRHVTKSLDDLLAVYQCKMAACEAQTKSLDDILAVYQFKMAACEAQTVHQQRQQQQQQQQQQDQQGRMLKPQGSDRLRGNGIEQHEDLEKTSPGLGAVRVISIPGSCNEKDEEMSSISLATLKEERGHAGSISRKLKDAQTVNTHS